MRARPMISWFLMVFAVVVSSPVFAAPVVFRATESAGPGSIIELQGADFGSAPRVSIMRVTAQAGVLTPTRSLTVLNRSDICVTAQIPADFAKGLYAVWVDNNGVMSPPVMINQARINQVEFPEVDPGRRFRLFGRNLKLDGFTPSVWFVDASGTRLEGSIVGGDAYAYKVKAPAGALAGGTYKIHFRNGAGGDWGETIAADPLPVRAGGDDPFTLGGPWAGDCPAVPASVYDIKSDPRLTLWAKGDGTTDDAAAIQNAIDVASAAGGGVVHFPNGSYNIVTFRDNIGLVMKSNVVLRGQSRNGTVLKFTPTAPARLKATMIQWGRDAKVTGLFRLTVLNNSTHELYTDDYDMSGSVSKVFVKDVTIDLNKWGPVVSFEESTRVLLDNVMIANPNRQGSTLQLSQPGSTLRTSHYAIVRGSTFPNVMRRLLGGVSMIMENNVVSYNGDYQAELDEQTEFSAGEQNSLELRDKTVLLNNTFNHVGTAPFVSRNDGETILNQMSPLNDANVLQYDTGTATAGTPTMLTDAGKNWSSLNWAGFVVAIIDGPGTGQWRKIVSSTANSVTVNAPWSVAPTSGSRYTLMKFGIQTLLVKGNTLQNKERGVWIYTGGQDLAIVDNRFTDAAGVWIRSIRYDNQLLPAWDVVVANNRITRTGTTRPAHIAATASEWNADVFGSSLLGVEVRGNSISAALPELIYGPYPILRDGYTAAGTFLGDGAFGSPSWTKASLRGVIFDGNSANNVESAYHLSSGTYQTVIANASVAGVSQLVQDWGTYDGRLLNGASWTAGDSTLRVGNLALSLDGIDDRVALGLPLTPGASRLPLGPAFTLEARVRITSLAGPHSILDLGGNGPSTNPQWGVHNGKVWLHSRGTVYLVGNLTVNDGGWHHVAASYDGAMIRFYVDGVLDSSFPANLIPHPGFGASLGGNVDGNWRFPGSLDEVRIWNIARSEGEIRADAHRELTVPRPGLTNYWRFEEGAGTWANDTVFEASVDTTVVPN